jgi:hypothetical protein
MSRTRTLIFIAILAMFAILLIASEPVRAGLLGRALAQNGAPQVVNYQGQVTVTGMPYTGTGYFKFAVINSGGTTTYWSNDGTVSGQPAASVSAAVSNGLFNVLLGDISLTNMQALPASAFSDTTCYLRAWFSSDNTTFTQLTPDRRVAAVPYALQAEEAKTAASAANSDTLDGLHASAFRPNQNYANIVVVAKSGGDFTTISAALASITTASSSNTYLVQVMPGIYSEQVTMKSYVDIAGSGELTTKITQPGSASDTTGTVVGADNAEMRSLTVENTGGEANAIAIYNAPRLAFVTANASGGTSNFGIYAAAPMHDVTVTVTGGSYASGMTINSSPSGFKPLITNVVITASGATIVNRGIYGGSEILQDAIITVSGGDQSEGITSSAVQSSPTFSGVTITVSGATSHNYGIFGSFALNTVLRDCVISATGTNSYGTWSVGVPPTFTHTLTITGSQISGTTGSVYSTGVVTQIGATQLGGGAVHNDTSTMTCAGVYDEAYVFSASTCP